MKLDKNLLALLKNARIPFVFTISSGALTGLAIIFKALILSRILNSVFLEKKNITDVQNYIFILIFIVLLQFLFSFLRELFSGKTSEVLKSGLRKKLINHLNHLGPIHARHKSTGELSGLIVEGIDGIDKYFSRYLPGLFLAVIIPVTVLFFVFPKDIISGIILLVTAPLIPFFMILIGGAVEKLTKRQWNSLSRMSSYFLDMFQGIVTLKIFNRSREQIDELKKISEKFRKSTMSVMQVAFLSALALEILASLSTAIIAVEIGVRLLNGDFSFQIAIFILIITPEFYIPLRSLGTQFHAGQESVSASQKLYEVLDYKSNITCISNKAVVPDKPGTIQFHDVSFKYDFTDRNALNAVNIKVEKGKFTALAGYSGAGKSTIVNMILKFINPAKGKILYNDQDLLSVPVKEWRKIISFIPQKPYIFHSTIKDNIDIGRNYQLEQVVRAAKDARIDDFISGLPEAYNTVIGERGAGLSAGQIQRIALARAFLKDSPVLILDEPTSNLDPYVEELIFDSFLKLVKNKTVLAIAHKLKTIKFADNIYVINHSRVEESGSHAELMMQKKIYYKMVSAHV